MRGPELDGEPCGEPKGHKTEPNEQIVSFRSEPRERHAVEKIDLRYSASVLRDHWVQPVRERTRTKCRLVLGRLGREWPDSGARSTRFVRLHFGLDPRDPILVPPPLPENRPITDPPLLKRAQQGILAFVIAR